MKAEDEKHCILLSNTMCRVILDGYTTAFMAMKQRRWVSFSCRCPCNIVSDNRVDLIAGVYFLLAPNDAITWIKVPGYWIKYAERDAINWYVKL